MDCLATGCPKCGRVDEGWLFCPGCGTVLVDATGAARWAAALRPRVRGANVAGFRVVAIDARLEMSGITPGGVEAKGVAVPFEVTGHDAHLWIGDVRWDNGEREIRTLFGFPDSSPAFDSFVDRDRVPVEMHAEGRVVANLRQARLRENGSVAVRGATVAQLDEGAGADVAEVLMRFGVERFGTRGAVLGDRSRFHAVLCAAAPASAVLAPVAAYVLARLAPIARGFDGVHANGPAAEVASA